MGVLPAIMMAAVITRRSGNTEIPAALALANRKPPLLARNDFTQTDLSFFGA